MDGTHSYPPQCITVNTHVHMSAFLRVYSFLCGWSRAPCVQGCAQQSNTTAAFLSFLSPSVMLMTDCGNPQREIGVGFPDLEAPETATAILVASTDFSSCPSASRFSSFSAPSKQERCCADTSGPGGAALAVLRDGLGSRPLSRLHVLYHTFLAFSVSRSFSFLFFPPSLSLSFPPFPLLSFLPFLQ